MRRLEPRLLPGCEDDVGVGRAPVTYCWELSRSRRTASVGRYRVARDVVTPERANVRRIISTSASAYRWVVAT